MTLWENIIRFNEGRPANRGSIRCRIPTECDSDGSGGIARHPVKKKKKKKYNNYYRPINFNISIGLVGFGWIQLDWNKGGGFRNITTRIVLLLQATMTNTVFFYLENCRSSWKIWNFVVDSPKKIARFFEGEGRKVISYDSYKITHT